jgi:pimeloyl-[acyl-carrier protein] synthase
MAVRGFDVDFSAAARLGNHFLDQLNDLRELDPVHWSEASRCWIVTRHSDVHMALQGEFPLSQKRLIAIGLGAVAAEERARLFPTIMKYVPSWIIDLDPPDHTRVRKLLVKAFNRKVVEGVRPFVRQRIGTLLNQLAHRPNIEFNEEIARQLPGSVILKLLGLPQEYITRLRGWSNALQEGIGVPFATVDALQRADQAMSDMNSILIPAIEERRATHRDDLLTSMIQVVDEGENLSLNEMLGSLHVLIVAGHDTTSNSLSLGVAALAQHPEIWAYLYQHPERSSEVCLELMRYIAMATSQPRIVASDFPWHGKHLKRGDIVFLMLASANRDQRVFQNPQTLDPHRNNDRSMVFAPGLHHCIGHLLAKMQVEEFFSALVKRFSRAQVLDESLHFMPQIAFRGLYDLHVQFTVRDP